VGRRRMEGNERKESSEGQKQIKYLKQFPNKCGFFVIFTFLSKLFKKGVS
jgi:hypothetical protein